MIKSLIYKLVFASTLLLTIESTVAQTADTSNVIVADSTIILRNDSLPVIDTIALDSVRSDSTLTSDSIAMKQSRWSFISGGNDSTYFSFYGHLIDVKDSIVIDIWRYNKNTHELEVKHFDSTLNNFHIFHPAFKHSFNNTYLGNSGLAAKSNLYFDALPQSGFIFMNAFNFYNFESDNAEYYNVLKPFTKFDANIGPKDEQDIKLLHTQNVNPYLNGFIRFKNYTGKGHYILQETRNNSGTIGGSYTQGPLATHINYTFSNINAQENGGIVDPFYITDTTLSTNQISTRLTGGNNYLKDRRLFIDQKIGFFKTNVPDSAEIGDYWFSLQYNFQQHKSLKVYEDSESEYYNPILGDTLNFYQNNYSGTSSFDSVYYLSKNHLFRLNLEEIPYDYPFVGAYAGFGIESTDYSYYNVDSLFNNSKSEEIKSTYLEGGIYRLRGEKFKFAGNYKFYITGYKETDFELSGFISQKFGSDSNYFELNANGGVYLETPDYFLTDYKSNHFRWNNDFNSLKRTELKFKIDYPKYNFTAGTRFSTLTDFVYFNNEALPEQNPGTFAVLDVYANKLFKFWKFGFKAQINYQKTGNSDVLPLPEFSGYAALYFAPDIYFKITDGRMKFQLGADAYYWTSFYAPAYSPATAQFHSQTQQLIGNYPFIGAFWNFEIKRLRFYLRGEHINYGLSESNYFLAPDYPSPRFVIRYGIAWTFYN